MFELLVGPYPPREIITLEAEELRTVAHSVWVLSMN